MVLERSDVQLAQPDALMFERNVAHLASREKEVKATTPAGTFVGFLTGLDELFVQICKTKDQKFVLVGRDQIVVEETGMTLGKVRDRLTEREARQLRERCSRFISLANDALTRKISVLDAAQEDERDDHSNA